ncbi:MAG TPA: ABC transporter permease [Bryobacteraceae bacterium]|nr:ABC transporter permease [Bryobacteraceae bacterium]
MRFHLEMKEQSADAHAARRQFGNFTLLKEVSREMWGWNSLERLMQDLRYALRMMRRSPGFAAIVVATLAIGIGANTAIFSIVDGVLLRPLPYPDADRLVAVYSHFSAQSLPRGTFSVADFFDLHAQVKSFDRFAAYSYRRWVLTGVDRPEILTGAGVTSSLLGILGAQPLVGRTFLDGEDKPNGTPLAVISESLWRRRFQSDRGVVGRSILLNGTSVTVVGVMPSSFNFPQAGMDLWQLMAFTPPTQRFPFFLRGIGRLKPGVSWEQAQAELNALAPGIERTDPATYQHLSFPVVPLQEATVGNVRLALLVILGAVGLVLLIAAVNVANLLLARAASREREIAIRMSIGAGRVRLVHQLLTESVLLALAGGGAGVLLAWWGVRWLRTLTVTNLPRLNEVHIDWRVLAFTLVISVVSGIMFGLAPAIETFRFRVNDSLKQQERSGTASRSRQRTRSLLVVAEVAFSFLLLIGAGLLLRSFLKLQGADPGFRTENLLIALVSPSNSKYSDDAKNNALYQDLLQGLHGLPGVESAALSQSLPPNRVGWMEGFRIEGRSLPQGSANPAVALPVVTPEYFRTMGIPLLRGRYFDDHDLPSSPPVVIISENMARRYFANQDPIGKRLMMGWSLPNQPWREIVGVVGDVAYHGLAAEPESVYYAPLKQNTADSFFLVIRAQNAARLADAVRATVAAIDKEMLVLSIGTMEDAMTSSVAQERFGTTIISIFGGMALLLAAIGIYGVVTYSVTQRMHEFGIRMALGAQRRDVLGLVARGSAVLVLTGMAAGCIGALALTRLISSLLFRVSPADPLTFAAAAVVLAGVALLASFVPAHRAIRVDPVTALRDE